MGPTPLITLLFALGAGFLAGLLANWAADCLPPATAGAPASIPLLRRSPASRLPVTRAALRQMPLTPSLRRRREQAVIVALMTLFALLACLMPTNPPGLFVNWCYAWFLVTVLVIDLETRRVLNIMLLPAAVFALAAGLWLGSPSLPSMLVGAAVAFAFFWCLYLFGRLVFGPGALGLGDVKLVAVIGLMTGYPSVLHALIAGALLGGVGATVLLATRRAGWKTTCAYAPYLAIGAMLALWRTLGG
jgi:leader peptidase (prepilin peptidase)/N-methyltransferase